jgi:hypothetical protein
MSQANVFNKSALFAAGTALTAVGFLIVAAPAQAAPACEKWGWPGGNFSIHIGNEVVGQYDVTMATSQDRVVGRPLKQDHGEVTSGTPSGGIVGGTSIDFTVNFDQGPHTPYSSHFTGKINDEGLASGIVHTVNRDDNWSSSQKFFCIAQAQQAPPPPPPPPPPKQGPTATFEHALGGLVVHITDRSGVTSQCTYTADNGFTRSFALKANSTFDLKIVPAIPEFRNWDVTISCDNGTSTKTTTFF